MLFSNSFPPNPDWSFILEIDRSFTLHRPKILILGKFGFIPLRHLLRHLKFSSHGSAGHPLYTEKKVSHTSQPQWNPEIITLYLLLNFLPPLFCAKADHESLSTSSKSNIISVSHGNRSKYSFDIFVLAT